MCVVIKKQSKLLLFVFLISAICLLFSLYAQPSFCPEIHWKHFIYGYPTGTPATNDLIVRDVYAISSNDTTKIADWVTYRLDKKTVLGNTETTRDWKADP